MDAALISEKIASAIVVEREMAEGDLSSRKQFFCHDSLGETEPVDNAQIVAPPVSVLFA